MGNIVVDNTIEFLKDESTGELVGYKRKDGTERGIATTVTDPLTGEISFIQNGIVWQPKRTTPLRVATFGDSRADVGGNNAGCNITDQSTYTTTFALKVAHNIQPEKWMLPAYYQQAYLVANGGIGGETTANMVARDTAASSTTRRSISDVIATRPEVVILRGASINNFITAANSGNWSSLADTAISEHKTIINRFLAAGIFVIDEMDIGTDGTGATSLPHVLLALQKCNAAYKDYAATLPGKVAFLDLTGITTDSTGLMLSGMALTDGQGRHASIYAQSLIAKEEAKILASRFGVAMNTRYQGINAMKNATVTGLSMTDNSLFASFDPAAGGYGAPRGFTIGANGNGTRQNGRVEVIEGKNYYVVECAASATGSLLSTYCPIDTTNFTPAVGDIYAFEMDYVVGGVTNPSYTPAISALIGRFDFTTGGNTINLSNQTSQACPAMPVSGWFKGRIVTQPFVFPADTAALSAVEAYLSITVSEVTTWKLGICNPRLVKLGQPVTTI